MFLANAVNLAEQAWRLAFDVQNEGVRKKWARRCWRTPRPGPRRQILDPEKSSAPQAHRFRLPTPLGGDCQAHRHRVPRPLFGVRGRGEEPGPRSDEESRHRKPTGYARGVAAARS